MTQDDFAVWEKREAELVAEIQRARQYLLWVLQWKVEHPDSLFLFRGLGPEPYEDVLAQGVRDLCDWLRRYFVERKECLSLALSRVAGLVRALPYQVHEVRVRLNLKSQVRGKCRSCGDSWGWKRRHVTYYRYDDQERPVEGCYPLCEECWVGLLDPISRAPYYVGLVEEWARECPEVDLSGELELIVSAVLKGG